MPTHANIVCILGMHRSGTSCLTGSLQRAGLALGKYHSWNRFNQKGNRENQDIVDFHEELLAANNASWDRPPARLRFEASDVTRARALIESYRGNGPWGFKDPRSLLALDLWKQAAPSLRCVGIFRHPRAVAESLKRRSGGRISTETAMELWLHYNQLLYRETERAKIPVVCFDWEENRFHNALEPILASLELNETLTPPYFYSRDLVHYQGSRWDNIPVRLKRLYDLLLEAAEAPIST